MKVLPKNVYLNIGSHVMETPEDIIINSQVYDKVTMEPKPFYFLNTGYNGTFYAVNQNNILEEQITIRSYSEGKPNKEPGSKYVIKDNSDPNVFYWIATGSSLQYFQKFQKNNDQWEITNSIAPDLKTYSFTYKSNLQNYKILGQNKKYILLFRSDNGYMYRNVNYPRLKECNLIRIKKEDMTYVGLHQGGAGQRACDYFPISISEDFMYLYRYINGDHYISRYNIESNVLDDIYSDVHSNINVYNTAVSTIGVSNIVKMQNKYYILTLNETQDKFVFREFTIDFITDIVTTIDYEIENDDNLLFHTETTTSAGGWLVYTLKVIDDLYIAITAHDNENETHYLANTVSTTRTLYSAKGYHGHAIYKFENNAFTLKDSLDIIPNITHIYGVLYLNQYIFVLLTDMGFSFYEFDPINEVYNKRYTKAGTYYTIGKDSMGRFYALNDLDECMIHTNITACILTVEFENESYNYDGENNISTYVTVSAKNFLLQGISIPVKLILTGQCEFSNGTQEYSLTTSANGNTVNVTVTGGGSVDCYVKEV